jgi:hypothetical protein
LNDGNGNNSGRVRVYEFLNNVGIETLEKNEILAYPNPTNGITKLEFRDNNIREVIILDYLGKLIMKKTELENIEQINLSGFDNGIYIIRVQTNNDVLNLKVVKE